jgi:hypothetical protein
VEVDAFDEIYAEWLAGQVEQIYFQSPLSQHYGSGLSEHCSSSDKLLSRRNTHNKSRKQTTLAAELIFQLVDLHAREMLAAVQQTCL